MSTKTFGHILSRRIHAQHRASVQARVLDHPDVAITEVQCLRPTFEQSDPLPEDSAFVAVLQLQDYPRHEWWEDGRRAPDTPLRAGDMTMYSLERDPRSRLNHVFHSIHLRIPRSLLAAVASEARRAKAGTNELAYAPGAGTDDAVFRGLMAQLRPALARPDRASTLFVDSVTSAVVTHLATEYGRIRLPRLRGRLSPRQQLRAFELIDARLDGHLTVRELATHCELSTSRFSSVFKRTTGVAPHRWLTLRRVERAKALLGDASLSLASIAHACGFADQSHLTHVFVATTGLPPGAWRRAGSQQVDGVV